MFFHIFCLNMETDPVDDTVYNDAVLANLVHLCQKVKKGIFLVSLGFRPAIQKKGPAMAPVH